MLQDRFNLSIQVLSWCALCSSVKCGLCALRAAYTSSKGRRTATRQQYLCALVELTMIKLNRPLHAPVRSHTVGLLMRKCIYPPVHVCQSAQYSVWLQGRPIYWVSAYSWQAHVGPL